MKDEAMYNISTMRQIVVTIMVLRNFICKSNLMDTDFSFDIKHLQIHTDSVNQTGNYTSM